MNDMVPTLTGYLLGRFLSRGHEDFHIAHVEGPYDARSFVVEFRSGLRLRVSVEEEASPPGIPDGESGPPKGD